MRKAQPGVLLARAGICARAIRVSVGYDIFRIFCFFDEGRLIILLQGFQKKSQKLPKAQIKKAIKLKKEYFDEKE